MMNVPLYSGWGWVWDGAKWVPLWTTKKLQVLLVKYYKNVGAKLLAGVIVSVLEEGVGAQHYALAEILAPIMGKTHRHKI